MFISKIGCMRGSAGRGKANDGATRVSGHGQSRRTNGQATSRLHRPRRAVFVVTSFSPKMHTLPRNLRLIFTGALALAAVFLISSCGKTKKTLKIGFAQTGAESAWRTANTVSM